MMKLFLDLSIRRTHSGKPYIYIYNKSDVTNVLFVEKSFQDSINKDIREFNKTIRKKRKELKIEYINGLNKLIEKDAYFHCHTDLGANIIDLSVNCENSNWIGNILFMKNVSCDCRRVLIKLNRRYKIQSMWCVREIKGHLVFETMNDLPNDYKYFKDIFAYVYPEVPKILDGRYYQDSIRVLVKDNEKSLAKYLIGNVYMPEDVLIDGVIYIKQNMYK